MVMPQIDIGGDYYEWRDLSDSELRVRLENRGYSPDEADELTRRRDDFIEELFSVFND